MGGREGLKPQLQSGGGGREMSKAERKGYKRADLHLSIFLIQQKVLEKEREGGKIELYIFLY